MTFRASSEGTERIRCNCFITMGEPHCWVHICLINYTTSPRTTLLFIKPDVWHALPFSYLTLSENSGGMRNDLRDAIRGQAAYLKRTDVAFKDRVETQRCVPTEGAPFETAHGRISSRRQKGASRSHFPPHSSVWRWTRRSSVANEARRRGPLGLGCPNYAQWGPSTLVLMFDLFPPPRLKAATLIVFTERRHTGRIEAR